MSSVSLTAEPVSAVPPETDVLLLMNILARSTLAWPSFTDSSNTTVNTPVGVWKTGAVELSPGAVVSAVSVISAPDAATPWLDRSLTAPASRRTCGVV